MRPDLSPHLHGRVCLLEAMAVEYERFTRLAAMWECANPGPGASDTCRDEYPEDADEWCLTCIARSILAASSHQDNEPEVKT